SMLHVRPGPCLGWLGRNTDRAMSRLLRRRGPDRGGRSIIMSRDGPAVNNEEALDKATLGFAAIIESSDIAIYSQDLDGIITSWNRASETLFGHPAVEVVGKAASATIIPPDRRAEEKEVLQRARDGHGIQHYETIRQR